MTAVPPRGTPVRAVLFDYGLTLVSHTRPDAALHRAYSHIATLLPPREGAAPWQAEELLLAVHDWVDERVAANEASGSLREIDVVAAHLDAYAALGVAIDPSQLDEATRLEQEAWWKGVHLTPGATETLATLRQAGMRLGICSNAAYRPELMHAQLEHAGIAALVDSAVFSSEVGWRKPSPHIFDAALRALGAEPATTVMVGDSVRADIAGAHGAGMRAIRVREHRDDLDQSDRAEAVVDRLAEIEPLLVGSAGHI